ncbi:MAG: hypothetical protein LBR55_06860 [Bacteroidales bacterium]|jgi:hypothetical protein|nr:hypothetical protein [Bacteroidales bacterium]
MKKYSKLFIISVLALFFVSCVKGIKIAKEEPVRKIISYSIYLKPTEKGHKPLMMYCNSEGTFINYENITFVRYGNEEELRDNWNNGVVDTIQVVFNAGAGNIKHNDKLCVTYPYYEKNEKNRGWYTLIVCDSVPTSLTYERNDKKVKYDVVSYTICKNAPSWNDTYPDMLYYPETDEYYKTKDDESDNYVNDGFDDISKIPPSIIQCMPNEYSIADIVFGDLNDDKIDDAVLVLENPDTYYTKLQILFGKGNNTFYQYKILDCNIRSRGCEETYIGIKDGVFKRETGKWACGMHGSHWTLAEYFKYSPADNQMYLIDYYLLSQEPNQYGDYDEVEYYTKYLEKTSIEEYYKSME